MNEREREITRGAVAELACSELRARISQLEAQLREREAECERSRIGHVQANEFACLCRTREGEAIARAESAETALAALDAQYKSEVLDYERRIADAANEASATDAALAAARAENEQIRIALGKQQAETCRILRETRADVENMSLDGDVMTANLRVRPDDGRVERVARMIIELELGHDGAEFSAATMENAPELARRLLAAADGKEKA